MFGLEKDPQVIIQYLQCNCKKYATYAVHSLLKTILYQRIINKCTYQQGSYTVNASTLHINFELITSVGKTVPCI